MKIKRALPILWLPLIALWSFLFAIQSGVTSTNLEDIVPLISYFLVSFLLVLQLQLVLGNKSESGIVKFGTTNVISFCLSISTLSIILNLVKIIDNQLSLLVIISPLIINTIIAEIFSATNKEIVKKKDAWIEKNQELEEKQIKASAESSKERDISSQTREKWKKYLQEAAIKYQNIKIIKEINRIGEIVSFSSYFWTVSAEATLEILQEELNEEKILIILKEIK